MLPRDIANFICEDAKNEPYPHSSVIKKNSEHPRFYFLLYRMQNYRARTFNKILRTIFFYNSLCVTYRPTTRLQQGDFHSAVPTTMLKQRPRSLPISFSKNTQKTYPITHSSLAKTQLLFLIYNANLNIRTIFLKFILCDKLPHLRTFWGEKCSFYS